MAGTGNLEGPIVSLKEVMIDRHPINCEALMEVIFRCPPGQIPICEFRQVQPDLFSAVISSIPK